MSDTNTARERLLDVISFAECANGGTTPEALLDEYDAVRRNEVLTEGADLLRAHRGDLCDGHPWWDTRDRDTAIAVLLAARTEPSDQWVVCSPGWLTAGGDCPGTPRRPATDPRYSHEHLTTTAPTTRES